MHLLYCYILFLDENGKEKRYRGLEQIEVNLSADDTFEYDKINNVLSRKKRKAPLPANFWTEANTEDEHHNIYNINVIAGRNGSGKTTAIHCMMDLLEALYSAAITPAQKKLGESLIQGSFRNRFLVVIEEKGIAHLLDCSPPGYEWSERTKLVGFSEEKTVVFQCRRWKNAIIAYDENWKRITSLLLTTKVIYFTNALSQFDYEQHKGDQGGHLRDSFIYDASTGASMGTNLTGYFPNEVYKQVRFVFNSRQTEMGRKINQRVTGLVVPRAIRMRLRGFQSINSYEQHLFALVDFVQLWVRSAEEIPNYLGMLCVDAYTGYLKKDFMTRNRTDPFLAVFQQRKESWVLLKTKNGQKNLIQDLYRRYIIENAKRVFTQHTAGVTCMTVFSRKKIVSGSGNGELRLWAISSESSVFFETEKQAAVTCISILANGDLVCGYADASLRVWQNDADDHHRNKRCIQQLIGHKGKVTCAATTHTDQLVSASDDHTLRVWDYDRARNMFTEESVKLTGHAGPVTCLQVLSDGRFVSGSEDATLRVWSPESGKCMNVLEGHQGAITCISELSDGHVVSGGADAMLRICDLSGKTPVKEMRGHTGAINCIMIMEQGQIVSASDDATLRIWNSETGASTVMRGHEDRVTCIAQLSDDLLASGSDDGTIRIWNSQNGQCQNIIDLDSKVTCLEVLPDGELACGLMDGRIYVWNRAFVERNNGYEYELKTASQKYIEFLFRKKNELFSHFVVKENDTLELSLEDLDENSSVFKDFTVFIQKYQQICRAGYTIDFDWGLSSGEENMLRIFSNLYDIYAPEDHGRGQDPHKIYNINAHKGEDQERTKCETVLLLMDEADLTLHPEWQRCLVDTLSAFIPQIYPASSIKDIQMILSTHSPLILGDIPSENITYLYGGEDRAVSNGAARISGETFGQNIHTILKENFFLNHGTVGAFAANKINGMAERLMSLQDHPLTEEQDFKMVQEELKHIHQLIEIVAPGVLRAGLEQLYRETEANLNAKTAPQKELDRLRYELQQLSKEERQRLMKTLAEEDALD